MLRRKPIRVSLAKLPDLLRSILRDQVAADADLEIVGDAPAGGPAGNQAGNDGADVIVIELPQEIFPAIRGDLVLEDGVKLLGISPDGREAVVYHRNLSPEDLRETIRSSVLWHEQPVGPVM